jgi:hypothetical protein
MTVAGLRGVDRRTDTYTPTPTTTLGRRHFGMKGRT